MKFDRLLGIVTMLLQRVKVTAPELAQRFEVSRRTISRDIETLCQAGIPIVTTQGRNGGITIMEGYSLDRTLLTSKDMQAILAGLRSLDSVSGTNRYRQLMQKLSPEHSSVLAQQHILINLSSWYRASLEPKIELLQGAMDANFLVEFTYYGPCGKSVRIVEPYFLMFQWSSWYLWAFCYTRQEFRLFKLNRMLELRCCSAQFAPRPVPAVPMDPIFQKTGSLQAVVLVEPTQAWRLIDEFGPDSFTVEPSGKLRFCFDFFDEENLVSWLFSLADQAQLLEPSAIRARVRERLERMQMLYQKQDG